ncbi:hypothetical protein ZWY2020_052199 [Hordeum vulgare]|nr:hypothetical protein ZWY2020_052199 [Hordeum vulgare]
MLQQLAPPPAAARHLSRHSSSSASAMPHCFSSATHRLLSVPCVPCAGRPCSHAAHTSMSLRHHGDNSGSVASRTTLKFLLGQSGFGRVCRCHLRVDNGDDVDDGAPMPVAVKQLCRSDAQGSHKVMVECAMLMTLRHPNLVALVGYCP